MAALCPSPFTRRLLSPASTTSSAGALSPEPRGSVRLSRRVRVAAGVLGAPLVAAGLFLAARLLVALGAPKPLRWGELAFAVFLMLLGLTVGGKLLYLAVTGRRRGRVQRWLSAVFDATLSASSGT